MSSERHRRAEIESAEQLRAHLAQGKALEQTVLQGIDLRQLEQLPQTALDGSVWIGCTFRDAAQEQALRQAGALIFPAFAGLPYDPYRGRLYSVDELMAGYAQGGYTATRDFRIYTWAHRERRHPDGISIREALTQRLHDHAIDDALAETVDRHRGKGVVGVMGGHGTPRSDPYYRKVALLAWQLTRRGYLVVTGGGPGVMEAANLGAWLAGNAKAEVIDRAIALLRAADTMSGGHPEGTPAYLEAIQRYIASAQQVVDQLGRHAAPGFSLAIPTWFYGHEPSNLFSSAVAKYFDNSIREEGLLALATAGVVYAPGSAGTMQEIFQDLTQNHYATYGVRSPMVLLGTERYRQEYDLLRAFVHGRGMDQVYGDLLTLEQEVDAAVRFIEQHPPRPAPIRPALYELLD